MTEKRRILWLNNDRFDTKPNKSAWVEMPARLGAKGYDVYLITGFEKEKYKPEKEYPKIVSLRAIDIPLVFRITLMLNSLFWLLINAKKEDIIILNPDMLWIAPFISAYGIKNIHLDIRTLPLTKAPTLKRRVDNYLFWTITMKYLRGSIKGYSFITNRLKKAIENELSTTFDNYEIWSSGVDIERFKPKSKNNITQRKFTLFYHGSIYAHRGLEEIVEAVETLDNCYRENIKLVIVGTGTGIENLKKISRSHNGKSAVEYKGFVPYEKIPEEISLADCCICPLPNLLQWNVSSPLKILEYLASGKPAIITPIPAHTDIFSEEKFIVWTKGQQVNDFQKAIIYAYENHESLRKEAKQAPKFIASRYNWDILGEKFANYLYATFHAETKTQSPRQH